MKSMPDWSELKSSPDVPVWAGEELKKMGRIRVKEIVMVLLALLALVNATTVALLGSP
jgi:di/tricarboxylate transporter